MTDAAALRWSEGLLRTGRVEIRANRRRLVILLLVSIAFTLGGVLLVTTSGGPRDQIGGWAAIAFFGVLGIPALTVQVVRGGSPVVVTRDWIVIGRGVSVPWVDVAGVGVVPIRGTRLVVLRLRDRAAQHRALAARPLSRLLAPINDSIIGAAGLSLPSPLDADPQQLAGWLGGLALGASR